MSKLLESQWRVSSLSSASMRRVDRAGKMIVSAGLWQRGWLAQASNLSVLGLGLSNSARKAMWSRNLPLWVWLARGEDRVIINKMVSSLWADIVSADLWGTLTMAHSDSAGFD